jgi:hypothetical protein
LSPSKALASARFRTLNWGSNVADSFDDADILFSGT